MSAAEVRAELRNLVSGRVGVADGIAPPLLFVGINAIWGLTPAAVAGIGSALAITGWRLLGGRPLRFAIAGLFGTALAVLLAVRSGSAEDYFLPGIISGALTTAVIIASIAVRKPFVAWTRWLTRGWPLDWYWHDRVRPAYSKASWMWAGFFGLRTAVQWRLFVTEETVALGIARVVMGWPMLLALLIGTYVLGRRWLTELGGPSVAEFETGVEAPWKGQEHGF